MAGLVQNLIEILLNWKLRSFTVNISDRKWKKNGSKMSLKRFSLFFLGDLMVWKKSECKVFVHFVQLGFTENALLSLSSMKSSWWLQKRKKSWWNFLSFVQNVENWNHLENLTLFRSEMNVFIVVRHKLYGKSFFVKKFFISSG